MKGYSGPIMGNTEKELDLLSREMEAELRQNILPFWPRFVDPEHGGFYGRMENDGRFEAHANKGLVMHARFLWTYAAAARLLKDPSLLVTAEAAYRFIAEKLHDHEHNGFFWLTDYRGNPPSMDRKVVYGQAFALYALAEYARASASRQALDFSMETFRLLELYMRDANHGGYFEASARDWSHTVASALSDVDLTCEKSMNTHLHVLEALSALYTASGDADVLDALRRLIDIHLDHILVSPGHLGLFFKRDWSRMDSAVSFGHDIEASWLLTEAAQIAWEGRVPDRVKDSVLAIAAASAEVLDRNGGSLPNELKEGHLDADRIWWVQAETIVGMVNAWELSRDQAYLRRAVSAWNFVQAAIIDREHGEWYWGARANGVPLPNRPKGGLWKASYHNGRACMEVMSRAARARKDSP